MLPATWTSTSLAHRDARPSDRAWVLQMLQESQDMAARDPAFGLAPQEDIEALIEQSTAAARAPGPQGRGFQMQLIFTHRGAGTGPEDLDHCVGYWHLMRVPADEQVVGVSILLIRPSFRRQGLGAQVVDAAQRHLHASARELWARVYLANPRALAFWAAQGLTRLAAHKGEHVHAADGERPSIILSCTLGESR
jgi:GNAT superfamily N-acetyltransferase